MPIDRRFQGSLYDFSLPVIPVKPVVHVEGPPLVNLDVVMSSYGKTIPYSFGTRRLAGTGIWATKIQKIDSTTVTRRRGKGGGGSSSSSTTTKYVGNFAVSFGYSTEPGETRDLLRIWADGKLIYDPTNVISLPGLNFRFYPGSETQLQDPLILADKGEETSGYRGQMYCVFENLDLTTFGNRIPFITIEIADETEHDNTGDRFADTYLDNPRVDNGLPFAFDWARRMAWSPTFNPDISTNNRGLKSFGLDSLITGSELEVDFSRNYLRFGFEYVPPVNRLVGVASANGYLPGYIISVNPDTGAVGHESTDPLFYTIPLTAPGTTYGHAFGTYGFRGRYRTAVFAYASNEASYPATATAANSEHYYEIWEIDWANATITRMVQTGDTDIVAANLTRGRSYDGVVTSQNSQGGVDFYFYGVDLASGDGGLYAFRYGSSELPELVYSLAGYSPNPTIDLLQYFSNDDSLVVSIRDVGIAKVSASTGSVYWQIDFSFATDTADLLYYGNEQWNTTRFTCVLEDDGAGTSTAHLIKLSDGSVTSIDISTGGVDAFFNIVLDDVSMTLYAQSDPVPGVENSGAYLYAFNVSLTGGRTTIGDVILALGTAAGFEDGEIEVENLDDPVDGCFVIEDADYQTFLTDTSRCYGFDIVNTGTVIKLVRRETGAGIVVDHEIIASLIVPEERTDGAIQTVRAEEATQASQVEIQYPDKTRDYQWSSQYARRHRFPLPTVESKQTDIIKLPVIMTANEAATLAHQALYRSWLRRVQHQIKVMPYYLTIEPGDIVDLPWREEDVFTCRVNKASIGADHTIELGLDNVWTSDGIPEVVSDGGTYLAPTEPATSATRVFMIDTPLLSSGHDLDGAGLVVYYLMQSGGGSNWLGADLWFSYDGGANYDFVGSEASTVLVGVCIDALGDTDRPFSTDYDNTVTIRILTGDADDISTITYLQMLNGEQAMVIGQPGRWEIVLIQSAVQNGDGTVTLSVLGRGKRGSEWACGLHESGDFAILLDSSVIDITTIAASDLNASISVKGVGVGGYLATTYDTAFDVTGNAEKPYSPVHLDASSVSGLIRLTWERRSRLDAGLRDGTDVVALGEDAEQYDIEFMASLTVVRTVTNHTTTSYDYTDFVSDYGGLPADLTFRVYQKSALVGRGFVAEATVIL